MKKFILSLIVTLISICAYANVETPQCSGNDGVSYVQGQTTHIPGGGTNLVLNGYGNYQNATVQVKYIAKTGSEYFTTCEIKNGKGSVYIPLNKTDLSDIQISVAAFCK